MFDVLACHMWGINSSTTRTSIDMSWQCVGDPNKVPRNWPSLLGLDVKYRFQHVEVFFSLEVGTPLRVVLKGPQSESRQFGLKDTPKC